MLAHSADCPHNVRVLPTDQSGNVPAIRYKLPVMLEYRQLPQMYFLVFWHEKTSLQKVTIDLLREV